MEHDISGICDVAHAAGPAVVFPALLKQVLKHDIFSFDQCAFRVRNGYMDYRNP